MFIDHSPNRPVRHLKWRLRLVAVGAVCAVVGIYLDSRPIVWVAIAFLVAAFVVRLLPDRESGSDGGGPPSAG